MNESVPKLLTQRNSKYGMYASLTTLSQNIKHCFTFGQNWDTLPFDSRESLEMIAHKIARILNGDPEYADSWVDICGYATLVSDRLLKKGEYHQEPITRGAGAGEPTSPNNPWDLFSDNIFDTQQSCPPTTPYPTAGSLSAGACGSGGSSNCC